MCFNLLILGGGAVVEEYYLPALRFLEDVVVTVADRSTAQLETLKNLWPQVNVVAGGYDDVLQNHADYDAVVVALPNHLHADAVELVLRCGLPVLCEKPLTLDRGSAQHLAELADEVQGVLSVGMTRRYIPGFTAMRNALASGLTGHIISIDIEYGDKFAWLSDTGDFFQPRNGGVLADMGIHYLDMAESLIGDLEPVSYEDDWCGGVESECEFKLISATQKVPVSLCLSRLGKLNNRVRVTCDKGELSLYSDTFDYCEWRPAGMRDTVARLTPDQSFKSGNWPLSFASCFIEQFHDFIQCVQSGDRPVVDAYAAARTVGHVEWAYGHHKETVISHAGSDEQILSKASVLVTGATGFIGGHLVEQLYRQGVDELSCPVRGYSNCAYIGRFPVSMPRYNILDLQQVQPLLDGRRYVFHLAYGTGSDQEAINVQGTKNIVEAAIAAGVECVVVLSTMYVYGHPETDKQVDESWPYDPAGGLYGKSKAKMERWLLERAKTSGKTRIVVLNPSCVYGPRGGAYSSLPASLAAGDRFCWIEQGCGVANITYVGNLIDAMLRAAIVKEAHGKRFLINDGVSSWREFLQPLLGRQVANCTELHNHAIADSTRTTLKDVVGHILSDYELMSIVNRIPWLAATKRRIFSWLPSVRNSLSHTGMEASKRLSLMPPEKPRPPEWLADLYGPTVTHFSSRKARDVLGWKSKVKLDEGQQATLQWLSKYHLLD